MISEMNSKWRLVGWRSEYGTEAINDGQLWLNMVRKSFNKIDSAIRKDIIVKAQNQLKGLAKHGPTGPFC